MNQASLINKPGCLLGFLAGFIGTVGMIVVIALLAGLTFNQINQIMSEGGDLSEAQPFEVEEPVGELPPVEEGGGGEENPAPVLEQESASPNEDESDISATCNATQYLQVTSEIVEQETSEFGTQVCKYTLTATNIHPDTTVWFFFYEHEEFGEAVNKDFWGGLIVNSGQADYIRFANVIADREDVASMIQFATKIAGVFDLPECLDLQQNDSYLEEIAIPVEPLCP